jgi:hypothetical protein
VDKRGLEKGPFPLDLLPLLWQKEGPSFRASSHPLVLAVPQLHLAAFATRSASALKKVVVVAAVVVDRRRDSGGAGDGEFSPDVAGAEEERLMIDFFPVVVDVAVLLDLEVQSNFVNMMFLNSMHTTLKSLF